MSKPQNPQDDLEARILNKILVQLYLTSTAPSHPARTEKMGELDERFGIKRPSAAETRRYIEELSGADRDLDGEMRARIIEELVILDPDFPSQGRARIEALFNTALEDEGMELPSVERQRFLESIVADVLGFGPLEPLLYDETVTEIMVDGPNRIYVERSGQFEDLPSRFRDEEHLMRCIRRILQPLGGRLDKRCPFVDARLPDGSRVNVVIPPISLVGPALVIRKFQRKPLTTEDLLSVGSWNEDIVEFLRACVHARLNIVVTGGTGSGKTTVLNLLAGMIPDDERVITIENAAELKLPPRKYLVALESRPPDVEDRGGVTIRDLVLNALRMRPDRIVVGEVRASEALELFQAMNTGHDGTMMTVHANSPRDVLARLETMATMANLSLPLLTIRQMMASAINLITHQERLQDGTRKILKVTEVVGMQGDIIVLQDLFEFRQTGVKDGQVTGHFTATGRIPRFLDRIQAAGVDLPVSMFTPS